MRVTWVDGPVTDVSNTTFSITQPTIGVTAPNTAVTWAVDTIRPITWSHNIPAGGRVNLDVSRDGGTSWTAIASSIVNTTASQGVFNWHVTGPITSAARIRARWEADGATTDMSNVNFTIADPSVVVTTPNTNVSWRIASVQTVRATHNLGAGSAIVFELSRDAGGSWEPLANVATTTGTTTTYAWTVNGPITSQARVRAYWEARPDVGDVGDTNFTIQERITVTAPNTNVNWGVGTARVISWTHNLGVGSAVNVELSRDGGTSWETLAAGLVHTSATSGSLAWTVTGPPTQTALIRVSSAAESGDSGREQRDVPHSIARKSRPAAPTHALGQRAARGFAPVIGSEHGNWSRSMLVEEGGRAETGLVIPELPRRGARRLSRHGTRRARGRTPYEGALREKGSVCYAGCRVGRIRGHRLYAGVRRRGRGAGPDGHVHEPQ